MSSSQLVADPAPPLRKVDSGGRIGGGRGRADREAVLRNEVDPLIPVQGRAILLDAGILSVSMAVYVEVMIRAQYLYDRPETRFLGAALVACWLLVILWRGGHDARYLGAGSEEFKRVVSATATVLATISVAAYVLPIEPPLRLVLPSLLIGLLLLLGGRWALRVWLGRQRVAGKLQQSTLIVGDRAGSAALAEAFIGDRTGGYRVIGSVPPPPASVPTAVDAWLDDVMGWVAAHNVQAVAVVESATGDLELLRRLSWRLEAPRIDLLVSPVLADVLGPRVSVRPAAGLPLLHLEEPSLTGPKRILKRMLDLMITVPALMVLSPLFLVIGLAIKMDSPGRVFYVSPRVGRAGEVFGCLKFRSMQAGADKLRDEIIGEPDDDIATRYREDPRVTRVGSVLRRWSLDELPQLVNVAVGSMSLVGPRPMLPDEMALLADSDHRRHLTKPGITGLWQVSGRKEVAWADRMRMDLHYLENWSIPLDLVILAKTSKAVLSGHGAY
jgi:exopolysaccharide biosynthesis polyprenyl glycosylphosphotransferase